MAPASQSLGRALLPCLVAAALPITGNAYPDVLVTARAPLPVQPVVPVLRDIDPLALLLDNMRPLAARQAAQVSGQRRHGAPAEDARAGTVPLPVQAAGIFQAIGDASGVLGEASHFQIEESTDGMWITAQLPGHKLGTGGKHPLHVRVVNTTLVVKGAHETPPVVKEFQRSFNLPRRADLSGIQVDYSTSSGKLVISIPMRAAADEQGEAAEFLARVENSDKSEGIGDKRFADVEVNMRKFFEDSSRSSQGATRGASLRGRPARQADDVLGLFDQLVARGMEHEEVAAVTMFDPSGVYMLESVAAPGRYLSVGGAPTHGAGIQVSSNPEAAETRWRIVEQPGQMFNIESAANEREFVNIVGKLGGRQEDGSWIVQRTAEEDGSWSVQLDEDHLGLTSLWHITQTATGAFTFESELEDRMYLNLLAEANGSAASGALVHLWGSQANTSQWRIFKETAARPDDATRPAPGEAAREDPLPRGRERAVWHLGEDEDGMSTLEVQAPSGQGLRHEAGRLFAVNTTSPGLPGGGEGGPASATAPRRLEAGTSVGVPLALSERDCDASPDSSTMRCRLPSSHVREVPVRVTKDEL